MLGVIIAAAALGVMLELSSVIGYRICRSTAQWGTLLPDQVLSEKRFFLPKRVETLFT